MSTPRRSQAERSAATRSALVAAATTLFGTRGYHAVGIDEIVASAGVTKGALYHQFSDKSELFAAVLDQAEVRLGQRIGPELAALAATGASTLDVLLAGAHEWLQACQDPVLRQILLVDGPAVLGWERWRAIGMAHGLGMVLTLLEAGVRSGDLPERPLLPLAHVLIGALDEAALFVARAEDPEAAQAQMTVVLQGMIRGLVS